MDDKQKVLKMWQAYVQENKNPNPHEFMGLVQQEFNCNLEEAMEKSSSLLLTE